MTHTALASEDIVLNETYAVTAFKYDCFLGEGRLEGHGRCAGVFLNSYMEILYLVWQEEASL